MREDSLIPDGELQALFASVVRARGKVRKRELEVLYQLVVRGLSVQEVAGVLVISPRTVESHMSNARWRLGYESPALMRDELFRAFARAEAKAEVGG